MHRFPTLLAVLLSAALTSFPLANADAATRKKKKPASADEAATSSTKKKSTDPTDKPTPPVEATGPESTVTTKKGGAPTSLNLPLPIKPEPGSSPESDVPPKKPAEPPAAPTKPASEPAASQSEHAPNATVEFADIVEFAAQPPRIQQLIRDAIDLTRLNLTYTFGSADPDSGGMDCSGTIYYLLRAHRFADVPRDSSGQYLWARKSAFFFPVVSKKDDGVEFDDLLPGDLMFWTGTYDTKREIPISHVMLYLGREKETGNRIMFGASDGRTYHGVKRWGVSVFDFTMPKSNPDHPGNATADFVGYARIPALRSGATYVPHLAAGGSAGTAEKTTVAGGEPKRESSATKSKSASRKKKKN